MYIYIYTYMYTYGVEGGKRERERARERERRLVAQREGRLTNPHERRSDRYVLRALRLLAEGSPPQPLYKRLPTGRA